MALPLMIHSVVGGARTRNADFDPLLSSPLQLRRAVPACENTRCQKLAKPLRGSIFATFLSPNAEIVTHCAEEWLRGDTPTRTMTAITR